MSDHFIRKATVLLKKHSKTFSLMLFVFILSNLSDALAQSVPLKPITLGLCYYEHIANAQGIPNITMGYQIINPDQSSTESYPSLTCSAYSCYESAISALTATPDPILTVWNLSLRESPQVALSSIVSLEEQTLNKQTHRLSELILSSQSDSNIIKDSIAVQTQVTDDLWSSYVRAVLTRQNPDPQALTYDIVSNQIFKQLFGQKTLILNSLLTQFGSQYSNTTNGSVRHRILNSKQSIQDADEFTENAPGTQSSSLYITPLSRNLTNKENLSIVQIANDSFIQEETTAWLAQGIMLSQLPINNIPILSTVIPMNSSIQNLSQLFLNFSQKLSNIYKKYPSLINYQKEDILYQMASYGSFIVGVQPSKNRPILLLNLQEELNKIYADQQDINVTNEILISLEFIFLNLASQVDPLPLQKKINASQALVDGKITGSGHRVVDNHLYQLDGSIYSPRGVNIIDKYASGSCITSMDEVLAHVTQVASLGYRDIIYNISHPEDLVQGGPLESNQALADIEKVVDKATRLGLSVILNVSFQQKNIINTMQQKSTEKSKVQFFLSSAATPLRLLAQRFKFYTNVDISLDDFVESKSPKNLAQTIKNLESLVTVIRDIGFKNVIFVPALEQNGKNLEYYIKNKVRDPLNNLAYSLQPYGSSVQIEYWLSFCETLPCIISQFGYQTNVPGTRDMSFSDMYTLYSQSKSMKVPTFWWAFGAQELKQHQQSEGLIGNACASEQNNFVLSDIGSWFYNMDAKFTITPSTNN